MRAGLAAVAAVLVTCVAACGGAPAGPSGGTSPGAGAGAAVTITGSLSFAPGQIEVSRGTAVTWTNRDSTDHTVTAGTPGSPSGKFSNVVEPGKSITIMFSEAGTFTYFCSIHQTMRGTVTVK
jgi:plastocyanin